MTVIYIYHNKEKEHFFCIIHCREKISRMPFYKFVFYNLLVISKSLIHCDVEYKVRVQSKMNTEQRTQESKSSWAVGAVM